MVLLITANIDCDVGRSNL